MKLKLAILIGLFSALLTWNYAATPASDGATATGPAADALAKINTDFEALRSASGTDPEAQQKLVVSLFTESTDFLKKYPGDAHAPDVTYLWSQLGEAMEQNHVAGAPSAEEISKRLDALATDAKAPEDLRAQIRAKQITLAMEKAMDSNTPATWDDVEARFSGFEKEFGADYAMADGRPVVPSLRAEELSLLAQSPDSKRYDALVKKLAASPNPQLSTLAAQAQEKERKTAELKSKPLDLKFTAVDGKPVDVAKLRGKVVLVDFWATWCPSCVEEIPNVVAAYDKYHDKGFEVVGISLDHEKDTMTDFTAANGMAWPQYFDGKGWDNTISRSFGIDAIPEMWLVDKKGMLVAMNSHGDLDGQVAKLLAAP